MSKALGDFRKGSPAHLENLRNDTRIFALECQDSAWRETTLAKLAKLAKLQNLQNLRCRSAHCLQPVIPVPLRGGGRSSERCSEGPGVLVYRWVGTRLLGLVGCDGGRAGAGATGVGIRLLGLGWGDRGRNEVARVRVGRWSPSWRGVR